MKHFKIIILIILFLFNNKSYAEENIVEILKKNNNIIFIRHSLAPGSGDPENINLKDCKTQRNLNSEGIKQSKKIGNFFKKNKIPIDLVISSEWCRCKETALIAFKKFISDWDSASNLVLVTHYVVILEIFGIGTGSGEIIISNKKYEIKDRIEIN